MLRSCLMTLLVVLALFAVACGSNDSGDADGDVPIYTGGPDGDAPADGDVSDGDVDDTDGDMDWDDEKPVEDGDEPADGDEPDPDVFNPDDPGISVTMFIAYMEMMGQGQEIALGIIAPATREEFGGESDLPTDQAIDTCEYSSGEGGELVDECQSDADCAPEQSCLTDQDSGQKRCITEIELMDVGPFTVSGFNGGDKTFMYNSSQSGAYTENGQGDGSLQSGSVAFSTTYTIQGEGDEAQGLGAFGGTFEAPAQITLTSPTPQATDMGMMAIPVNPNADLAITWDGSGNPDNTFMMTISGATGTVTCLMSDDGAHTIPGDLIAQVGLNADPMWSIMNMVTIQSDAYGEFTGDGITTSEINFQQMIMLNATVVQ